MIKPSTTPPKQLNHDILCSEDVCIRVTKLSKRLREWLDELLRLARIGSEHCQAHRATLPASAPVWLVREADRVQELVEVRLALAWPDFPEPIPMPRFQPASFGELLREGWMFHCYNGIRTEKRWVSSVTTYSSLDSEGKGRHGSQGQCTQYATELAALQAGYWSMCRTFAKQLRAAKSLS